MSALFVTGSGTDVGKTFVTASLVRTLWARGVRASALKPVVSGFDPEAPAGSDPAALLEGMGRPVTLEEIAAISPWQFRAPLSPDMAAAREGRRLDFDRIVGFCRDRMAAADSPLFVEGVGGCMVPLDEGRTVLDWMVALDLPVLLVVGSYLGTLSHSLTALDVLDRSGLTTRAIVVSETPGSTVGLGETCDTLGRFAGGRPVFALPRLAPGAEHPVFGDVLAALGIGSVRG